MSELRVEEDEEVIDPAILGRVVESMTASDVRALTVLEEDGPCAFERVEKMVDLVDWLWMIFFGVVTLEVDAYDRIDVDITKDGIVALNAKRSQSRN